MRFNDMQILVLVAIIPEVLFMIYLYKRDRVEKEPAGLLLLMLIGGILSCIPAIFLESVLEGFLNRLALSSFVTLLIDAYIVVAGSEECSKYFFLKLFSWRNRNFNSSFDGLIYSVFTSSGFALGENILYVLQYGLNTGITRAFTAIPAHIGFSVLMGIYYSKAKMAERRGNHSLSQMSRFFGILLAVLVHGTYDFLLFVGSDTYITVWMGLLAAIYLLIFVIVKIESKKDRLF